MEQETTGRRPSGRAGAPNTKGGQEMVRQNFSMHPDLRQAIFQASGQISSERADSNVDERARRVSWSKVTAALAWLLKTRYMTPEGKITDAFRHLIADYEATLFERPDDIDEARAEEIMRERRLQAEHWKRKSEEDSLNENEETEDGEESEEERDA